jgi:S1-C subfamily serine protease
MKRRLFFPIVLVVVFIMVFSTACTSSGKKETAVPTDAPQIAPLSAVTSNEFLVTRLEDVKKAVIQIESQGTFIDPEFGLQVNAAGRGTGFIIDSSGIAVTNNHVVTGAAVIKVWLDGESQPRSARLLGYSECNDLAVIKIDGSDFSYLNWFEGSVDVGKEVYLAGFPLGDPDYSLTKGIISKSNTNGDTSWTSIKGGILAHDATGNPGNSGGPLVTPDGEVVGIHFAGYKEADQYFAISAKTAMPIVEELKNGVNYESLGVNGSIISNEDGSITGVWVSSVDSGSPADKAAVQAGDIIYQLEGLVLGTDGTMADYCSVIRTHGAEKNLSISVLRFSTGEYLEGELNGDKLALVSSFGTTDSTDDSTSYVSGDAYFLDEFDGELSYYTLFSMSGDVDDPKMGVYADRGSLVFDLQDDYLWPYVLYDPWTYQDVRVDFEAENLGNNNNMVALICRYDPDRGWYEFNVTNSGLYDIYYYDAIQLKDYQRLYNGGSTAINMGRATNTYTIVCQGNNLSLYINGVLARTIQDSHLKEGQVGFSVSSFENYPVVVNLNWFAVSEP